LELQALGIVGKVLPLLLGRIEAGRATDFYASRIKDKLPHTVATPEIAAVQAFLGSKGWQASARLESMTVRGIVDAILRNLAIHLWDLPQEDPPDGGGHGKGGRPDEVEDDGGFVLLDFSSSYLYEAAATRIMQYVEQLQSPDAAAARRLAQPAVTTTPAAAADGGNEVGGPPVQEHGGGGKQASMPGAPPVDVPVWLCGVMQEGEASVLGQGMRRGLFDEGDLEFFSDDALREAGVASAITRARMLRRIRDHFKPLAPKP
jgi:hypothetical protein